MSWFGRPNRGHLSHFSFRAPRKNGDLGQLLEVDSPRITLVLPLDGQQDSPIGV